MNIVYFGDQWDDLWRRRQQIAGRLAQKEPIARAWYIEGPVTLTSLAKHWVGRADGDACDRWRRIREKGLQFETDSLYVVTPLTPWPTTTNSVGRRLNHWAYRLAVKQVAVANRHSPVLLWLSKPTDLPWIDYFAPVLTCYDSTERFWEFEDAAPRLRQLWQRQDAQLARRADVVFVQTEEHLREKQAQGIKAFLMPNAVDIDQFEFPARNVPAYLRDIPTPRIGYVGSINYRLNWDLVEHMLNRLPQFSMVFIGDSTDQAPCEQLRRRYPNIYFLGSRSYQQIPAYLAAMAVCIIPFCTTSLTLSQSPLKLFDYLAAGKPIVATNGANVGELERWVRIAEDYDHFCLALRHAAAEDCPVLQQTRRRIAARNSWAVRVEQIWEIVTTQLSEKVA